MGMTAFSRGVAVAPGRAYWVVKLVWQVAVPAPTLTSTTTVKPRGAWVRSKVTWTEADPLASVVALVVVGLVA